MSSQHEVVSCPLNLTVKLIRFWSVLAYGFFNNLHKIETLAKEADMTRDQLCIHYLSVVFCEVQLT